MNKVNYVAGRELTAADLNAIQDGIEAYLGEMGARLLPSHISGMVVSGTATGLSVSAGYAWDAQGRRLRLTAAADVDVSAVQRPASGQYRWALVIAAYARSDRGTVSDIVGAVHTAYYDDSVTISIITGPEFTASDISTARGVATGRPATPGSSVALASLIIDHATAWGNLAITSTSRQQNRPSPIVPGTMVVWPSTIVPDGWATCDGSAVSRTQYASLYRAIGVGWGGGDGSTTFNLPNMSTLDPAQGVQGGANWIIFLGEAT